MNAQWDGFSRRTVPATELPLTVPYVRDQVLRAANGSVEDGHIENLIAAAVAAYERETGKAALAQTWELVLDRFPCGSERIVIPRAPLLAVDSVTYVDTDGTTQNLATSPAEFQTIPSGEYVRGAIAPLYDATWPSTRVQPAAVTVTYRCGHETVDTFPQMALIGMCQMIAELYKQRSLSVQDVSTAPSLMGLRDLWRRMEG